MRSSLIVLVLVVAVLASLPAAAAQDGPRTRYFELLNRAHDRLVALAVAPAGSDTFQARPLGEPVAGGGGSATIELPGEACVYDLRFTFGNGRSLIYGDIDVCRNRSLRIQPLPRAAAKG